ncbi:MAG: S-methyl-5-thioribose-1-phosphate isomerase [Chlamydiota bacterium]|nr:S-methyl-5-thioribose-1-phosphate isomerase [Chlamydiota bacterium]
MKIIETMRWKKEKFSLLDQTLLPAKKKYIEIRTKKDIWHAIRSMQVRGAPAIGVAAAFGAAVWMRHFSKSSVKTFLAEFKKTTEMIQKSRPTAVNLEWAIQRLRNVIRNNPFASVREWAAMLVEEAEKIYYEERDVCEKLGEHGSKLIKNNMSIMTHCNAGALATPGVGTALAVLYAAVRKGKVIRVFVPETRPLLQGARLTAWELCSAGIKSTLICDSVSGSLMRQGKIDIIFVGADRIALNGDVANKIGTYNHAVLAKENKVPFYVVAPLSTFDPKIETGEQIPIEERSPLEVAAPFGQYITTRKAGIYNPAFDVTPNQYIAGIITEKGILRPPYYKKIKKLLLG